MDANPFEATLYVEQYHSKRARLGAAALGAFFFVITVPLWLWRRRGVSRVLAASWVICAVCLSFDLYLYGLSAKFGYPMVNIGVVQAADAPAAAVAPADEIPQAVLLRPTPTPTVALLPTVTPAAVAAKSVPLPTLTPQVGIPHWAVVTKGRLNLRAAPATDAEIVGKLATGECVEIVTVAPEWAEVRTATGEQGWSSRLFLKFAGGCPSAR